LTYQDPAGCSLRYPPGWQVFRHQTGATMVTSPDMSALVLLQELPKPLTATEAEIVHDGRFSAAVLLLTCYPGAVANQQPGRASCPVRFRLPGDQLADGLVTCEMFANGALVSVCAAAGPGGIYKAVELWRIKRSYRADRLGMAQSEYVEMPKVTYGLCDDIVRGGQPWGSIAPRPASPPPIPPPLPPPVPPPPAELSFEQFTDPQKGTFYLEVPRGWQVRGGFYHAGLGDRRLFAEVQSPDGISVMFGDPNFPQIFYHNPMTWGENFVTYPTGCCFLNLAASGKKLASFYFKNVASKRFGPVQVTGERDRKDLVEAGKRKNPQMARMAITVHEVSFRAGARSGRCLASSQSNGGSFIGDNWIGNVVIWLAPPGKEALGEKVAMRMIDSFQITPQLNQIVMQDEAMIAGNGNIAVANQQQWFAGQQAVHRAQQQFGDTITNNYWEQQRSHDRQMASWEHSQNVNSQASQNWSDAMLGQQRLYDEAAGKEYSVASGSNYYWVDSATGSVVGTATETSPDLTRDFRLLKKL
jgi:hypothetical protein